MSNVNIPYPGSHLTRQTFSEDKSLEPFVVSKVEMSKVAAGLRHLSFEMSKLP